VVLVTGGAKGITCEHALELGRIFKSKFALIGSSAAPEKSADPKNNEMLNNFRRFEKEGINYKYIQCDITNLKNVKDAVKQVEKELGTITAILHGAGVTKLTLLKEKDIEDYLQCIRIKTCGLYNLLSTVPPKQLKALHVISSVLGNTGMRGQADYTFANAWLDGAVAEIKKKYPRLHCLSLGYSVWSETGLGKKLGALDYLHSVGVVPIPVKEGISSYVKLVQNSYSGFAFVITGGLTPEIEANLYPPTPEIPGRFMEKIKRFIPGTELITEADLSFKSDLYIPEHVFEGTPMFPGVMAIEAMVQSAMACSNQTDLPVIRNVKFNRPLIISKDSEITIRILALSESLPNNKVIVKVAIKSESDNFQQNHFEADCYFDDDDNDEKMIKCPEIPEPIDRSPEEFSPMPLFQGNFFRRIKTIRKMEFEKESITEIQIPENEIYFNGSHKNTTVTPYPAARDSFLQSGGLILPPGCLPSSIEEITFCKKALPNSSVFYHNLNLVKSEDDYKNDSAIFDENGELIEMMKGVIVQLPKGGTRKVDKEVASPISFSRLESDLKALLPKTPLSLAIKFHSELKKVSQAIELLPEEKEYISKINSKSRQKSALCNLIAAKEAAIKYAKENAKADLSADKVTLTHRTDGKPELVIKNENIIKVFNGIDVSISDGSGYSIALVGPSPVAIDLEAVENRNTELWKGLLQHDGYNLALDISEANTESFDCSATRVWTLIETAIKANGLKRIIPVYEGSLGDSWQSFSINNNDSLQNYYSVSIKDPKCETGNIIISFALGPFMLKSQPSLDNSKEHQPVNGKNVELKFQPLISKFTSKLDQFQVEFNNDPIGYRTEIHHQKFVNTLNQLNTELLSLEKKVNSVKLIEMRHIFQDKLLHYLSRSEVFKHSLTKPLGYAGDFRLLDMLVKNKLNTTGLEYHFDRIQLEHSASKACRNRIEWVHSDLVKRIPVKNIQKVKILDIGIGAAPIEQRLVQSFPDFNFDLRAVDIEPEALKFVKNYFRGKKVDVNLNTVDLRQKNAVDDISKLSQNVDVYIVVGILEALKDNEVKRILSSIVNSMSKGSILYADNFLPSHSTRLFMEWLMDFYLAYRTIDELKSLFLSSGVKESQINLQIDNTKSLALVKVTK
ncbi:MAG: SDR family NAD(P)-dependent oxidoreductase, partial [Bacteroidales bacterium]|nr:SDR family NAD(P)-dependent oxidoreductase [Bacteroidales bacterium]